MSLMSLMSIRAEVTKVPMSENPTSPAVFFRHLPKTAGTSLITTLSNAYGEAHCHRFHDVGLGFRDLFNEVVQERGDALSLVTGHIPLSLIEDGACGTEITILRDPIARLLSMRRFFEGRSEAERVRLGFSPRVSVAELLASRNPEVYNQVHNGLTRFFCGSDPFADPDAPEFWSATPTTAAISECEAVLERMAVGTVEDMPAALRGIGHALRVPYDLETPIENTTSEQNDDVALEEIRSLVEANTVDIAIFHRVQKRLSARPPMRGHVGAYDFDPRTLFDPQPGAQYEPPHIPGRQGFLTCSPFPYLSWLGPTGRARIHVAPSQRPLALSFVLYGVVPHYPMDDIVFTLDGCPWPRECHRGGGHSVFALAAIPPHAGPVELAIMQPCAMPVRLVEPESPDNRTLGTALASVICEAA